jgi:hypothetical protein
MKRLRIRYNLVQEIEAIVEVSDKEYNKKHQYGIGYIDDDDLQTDAEGFHSTLIVEQIIDPCLKKEDFRIVATKTIK